MVTMFGVGDAEAQIAILNTEIPLNATSELSWHLFPHLNDWCIND